MLLRLFWVIWLRSLPDVVQRWLGRGAADVVNVLGDGEVLSHVLAPEGVAWWDQQDEAASTFTWQQWDAMTGNRILDPDGFAGEPLDRRYTRQEFEERFWICTVRGLSSL